MLVKVLPLLRLQEVVSASLHGYGGDLSFELISFLFFSRGFGAPFKFGIGPPLSLYETSSFCRSDETDHVQPVFTVQLPENLGQIERVSLEFKKVSQQVEGLIPSLPVISYLLLGFENSMVFSRSLGTPPVFAIFPS